MRGGPTGVGDRGGRGLRREGGTALTTWPGNTRLVKVPTPLGRKVGFGPRAISTVCSRYVGGSGPSGEAYPSSRATWTIRKTTSGWA